MKTIPRSHHLNGVKSRFLTYSNTLLITIFSLFLIPSLYSQDSYSTILPSGVTAWPEITWVPTGAPGVGDHATVGSAGSTLRIAGFPILGTLTFTNTSLLLVQADASGGGIKLIQADRLIQSGSGAVTFFNRTDTNNDNYKLAIEVNTLEINGATVNFGTSSLPFTSLTVADATYIESKRGLNIQSDGVYQLGEVYLTGFLNLANSNQAVGLTTVVHTKGLHGTGTVKVVSDNANPTLSIERADDVVASDFNGTFSESGTAKISVKKSGSGIQIFSNSEGTAYTGGTIIEEGTLVISNVSNSGLGTGDVEIQNGGILAGDGKVELSGTAGITVKSGGSFAPGAFNNETFNQLVISGENTTGVTSFESGSSITFNVSATGESDQINLAYYTAGDLSLAVEGIAVNVDGILSEGVTYTLFKFFSGAVSEGATVSSELTDGLIMGEGFEGYTALFHYDDPNFGGIGSITMTVQAIPEPNQIALIMILSLGFLVWRKKRIRK